MGRGKEQLHFKELMREGHQCSFVFRGAIWFEFFAALRLGPFVQVFAGRETRIMGRSR
jgi:hypothetical protein